MMGERILREFGMHMYTLLYLKWITNKDILSSTGNCAQYYVAAWMREKLGGEWIHVYVWLSPFAVHLKLSQHCLLIGYTPVQNKKLKKIVCGHCVRGSVLYFMDRGIILRIFTGKETEVQRCLITQTPQLASRITGCKPQFSSSEACAPSFIVSQDDKQRSYEWRACGWRQPGIVT